MRVLALVFVSLLLAQHVQAEKRLCAAASRQIAAKTTLASVAEDDYNVHHVAIRLQMTDTSVYVIGHTTTNATIVASSMTDFYFELDTTLNIDSAFVNGMRLSVSNTGYLRKITLPSALSSGAALKADIYYRGLPPGGGGGFFNGITHAVTGLGTHMVYTISDPYEAKNWWPCKQSIIDKIDSVDMIVSVPAGVADGSNGVLLRIDSTSQPGTWTYHWKTNYPIAYYLISIAIAKYAVYSDMHHFAGRTDSVQVQNFFFDTATFNPLYKRNFDSLGLMLDFLSEAYGLYPFTKEKYGVCYSNLPGGMEHQTMTTIGTPRTTVIAHELAHQWFGDNVTYRTWGDVWLSEGFATFTEQLYLEKFWGASAARSQRQGYIGMALGSPCGMVYVNDTTTSDSLFNFSTVYAKAQSVVRMLQYEAPDDSAFFRTLRTYQTNNRLGHASTADLKAIAEGYYGRSLDTFFNQWIYGRGFPIYRVTWNQVGSNVYVKLIQTTSCPSYTRHFNTALELQLRSASGDSFVKIYNNADTQLFVFNWGKTTAGITVNPNAYTLCRVFPAVARDNTLDALQLATLPTTVFPNPTDGSWMLDGLLDGTRLELFDNAGKSIWIGRTSKGRSIIPGEKLPPGNYLLRIGNRADTIVLVHL
jgi:aminopeptidase N